MSEGEDVRQAGEALESSRAQERAEKIKGDPAAEKDQTGLIEKLRRAQSGDGASEKTTGWKCSGCGGKVETELVRVPCPNAKENAKRRRACCVEHKQMKGVCTVCGKVQ